MSSNTEIAIFLAWLYLGFVGCRNAQSFSAYSYRYSGCFGHKNKIFYIKDVCIKAGMTHYYCIPTSPPCNILHLFLHCYPYNDFCGLKRYNCSSVYESYEVDKWHVNMAFSI